MISQQISNKNRVLMGGARSQKSKSFFKGGFFLNHLLDGPFTGSAPFARQFIERRGPAHILKNSGEWDKDPFARKAIRIWACQPNNPHPSTYFSTPCYLFSITILVLTHRKDPLPFHTFAYLKCSEKGAWPFLCLHGGSFFKMVILVAR